MCYGEKILATTFLYEHMVHHSCICSVLSESPLNVGVRPPQAESALQPLFHSQHPTAREHTPTASVGRGERGKLSSR